VVLREKRSESPLFQPEQAAPVRALVALDGSSFAEATLLPYGSSGGSIQPPATPGELHLLRVIKPPSDPDPEERRYLVYDVNIIRCLKRAKNKKRRGVPADEIWIPVHRLHRK
jgi:hypothetical protein